jgi:diguanylate cyclase (GGDEF)-like protein/PAS domain S-box-containing protein
MLPSDTQQQALAEALAAPDVLQRIAGTVAIHLYEMEIYADGSYACHAFIGAGLESLLGPTPEGMTHEEAWEAAVHPDDRDVYERASETVERGEDVELEYRLVGFDGVERWVWDRMHPRRSDDGRLLVEGIVADVTARRTIADQLEAAQRQLEHLAYHDPLTDLPNRIAFQDRLQELLEGAEGELGAPGAVLFVDLDNFKLVNDSFGHAAGDELLRAVAARLRASTRATDVVARQGGDEFLVLLTDRDGARQRGRAHTLERVVEGVARKIRRVLGEPFVISGIEIYVSASVGISLFPQDAADVGSLLKYADVAMYRAKELGRDQHQFYVRDGAADMLGQLSMAGRFRTAVEDGEQLVLHYQPIVRLETGRPVGVEALIRWQDGERLVPPAEFIPVAEQTGLIGRMSDWVIAEACRQAARWREDGLDLFVSINLPPSFWQPTAMKHVLATIDAFGLSPDRLMIEITESALSTEPKRSMQPVLAQLHARGLKLAIDDFGTGYSSLGRLNELWVNSLKIDRSFVDGLPGDEGAVVLVSSMIRLAHSLGLEPVAEGIETEEQRGFLLDHGCEVGQGFHFSVAVPAADVPPLFRGTLAA